VEPGSVKKIFSWQKSKHGKWDSFYCNMKRFGACQTQFQFFVIFLVPVWRDRTE